MWLSHLKSICKIYKLVCIYIHVYTHTDIHSHYSACMNRVKCLISHFFPGHCISPIPYHRGCHGNSRLNVAVLREITIGDCQCFWLFVLNFNSMWQILWLAFCECGLLSSSNQSNEVGSVISSLLDMRKLKYEEVKKVTKKSNQEIWTSAVIHNDLGPDSKYLFVLWSISRNFSCYWTKAQTTASAAKRRQTFELVDVFPVR